jgi:hypothetical protein
MRRSPTNAEEMSLPAKILEGIAQKFPRSW